MKPTLFFVIIALLAKATLCSAQDNASLEISPESGTINSQFVLDLRLQNEFADAEHEIQTDSADFEVQYLGPSTSVSIVNGRTSVSKTYSYILSPKKTGALKTPSVLVLKSDGTKQKLDGLSVAIGKKGKRAGNFSRHSSSKRKASSKFALDQGASELEAYVGQQVVISRDFSYSQQPQKVSMEDPSITGAWLQNFPSPVEERTRLGGKAALMQRKRYAVFPLQPGSLEIEPAEAEVIYRGRTKSPNMLRDRFLRSPLFDDFFSLSRNERQLLSSEALEIQVLPLPKKPKSFESYGEIALVGSVELEARLKKQTLRDGEGTELEIEVLSDANLSRLQPPELSELGAAAKVYSESPNSESFVRSDKLFTRKTFRYSLVPLRNGQLQVPEVCIPFFDPSTKSYKLARSRALSFSVSGVKESYQLPAETDSGSQRKSEESSAAESLSADGPIDYQPKTLGLSKYITLENSIFSLALLSLIALSSIFIFFIQRGRRRVRSRVQALENSNEASELLRSFEDFLLPKRTEHSEYRGLRHSVESKTKDKALRAQLLGLIDELQALLYSPGAETEQDFRRIKRKIIDFARQRRSVEL